MREPTREEMVEGIARGVEKFLSGSNLTWALKGEFRHGEYQGGILRDGIADGIERVVKAGGKL